MTTEEFKKEFEARRLKVEAAIDKYLPAEDTRPSIVHKAMRYSMEAGGKRIRPMLLLAAHDMFPSEIDPLPACVAIECLHTYSLIHDDLPCMDNSDLRRGKPTCHKQFDETMALLAGDALLTYSFRLLADAYKAYPKVAAGLVLDLSDAGGSTKMIGGQVEDVLGERDGKMTPEKLDFIHHNKTAALITADDIAHFLELLRICKRTSTEFYNFFHNSFQSPVDYAFLPLLSKRSWTLLS